MNSILVAAQTPPPYGGQTIMVSYMLDGSYPGLKLIQVQTGLSRTSDEVAKFRFRKIFGLVRVILKIAFARIKHGTTVLYYPPAGSNKGAMYRDIIILNCTRWLFRKVILHFHAGGISDMYESIPRGLRFFYRRAYYYPDVAIRLSVLNPEDGKKLRAKQEFIVPNGIPDDRPGNRDKRSKCSGKVNILFVGLLCESKGVMDLIKALQIVQQSYDISANFVGMFESEIFNTRVKTYIQNNGLCNTITFSGELKGDAKTKAYLKADIFCFPSFYESETFGIVLLEAMQFELPIVTTRWRGIPSVIVEGENGFLVDIQDIQSLADRLSLLIQKPDLRSSMGEKGRELYLRNYAIDVFHRKIRECFSAAF